MNRVTRRAVLRNTTLAASALAFSELACGMLNARAEDAPGGNVFHVFAFQWKPNATDADKARAAHDIAAFQGKITGLLETHVGNNLSPRGKGYTFGGIMKFTDKAALEAYTHHPMHLALLEWLVPLIDAIELDLPA
jgi:hypothetical protein